MTGEKENKRNTFEVPEGFEAVRDDDGRSTGELKPVAPITTVRAMAEAVQGDEEFGLTIDEVDSVDVQRVRKTPPMFRVIRNGKSMQVSMLAPGDLPREPDERGF